MTPAGTHIQEVQQCAREMKALYYRMKALQIEFDVQGGTAYTDLYNWPEDQDPPDNIDTGAPTKAEHNANYYAIVQLTKFMEGDFSNGDNNPNPIPINRYIDIFIKGG